MLKNAPVRASPIARSFAAIGMPKFPVAFMGKGDLLHTASILPARSTTATTIVVGDTEFKAALTIASTSIALNVVGGLGGIGVGVTIGVPTAPQPAIKSASMPAIPSGEEIPRLVLL